MTTTQLITDHDLISIGFCFTCAEKKKANVGNVDIESTLFEIIGDFHEDYRIASILMSWIRVNGNNFIVKTPKVERKRPPRETGGSFPWLTLVAAKSVECGYHKWRKLIKKEKHPIYLYPEDSESAILRKGVLLGLSPMDSGFR